MDETQPVYMLRLPFPPSVWRLYTLHQTRRRLVLTREGRDWKRSAGWEARAQGVRAAITGPVAVEMNLYPPADKRRRDGESSEKAVWDALSGVCYADDSQIVERHVYTHAPDADPRVELTVAPLELAGLVLCRVKNLEAAGAAAIVDLMDAIRGEKG